MWKSQNTRFIFSPEAAAESLPTCSKESRQSAPSKSWSTREPSSACASRACRSGTTCGRSEQTIQSAPECSQTYANTATRLSLPGAFRARMFHAREKARAYAAREADFGRNTRVSFARFDPVSYSWKIPHFLFQGDLATYSQTWPRWGTMVRGECFRLPPWVQDMSVNAFGELSCDGIEAEEESTRWPTVTVKGNYNRRGYGGKSGDGLSTAVNRAAESATWPTPTAHDRMPGTTKPHGFIIDGKEMQRNLNDVVVRRTVSSLWPTPCATDHKGSGQNGAYRDRLDYAVERGKTKSHIYPTVGTKTMGGCSGSFAKLKELEEAGRLTPEERRAMSSHITGGKDMDTANCRLLNPDWVEWLMGWPIRWTDVDFRNAEGGQCVMPWLDIADDPADWPTPLIERITRRKTNRSKRIETLGNGQVPLCAAVAFVWGFEILHEIVKGNEICLRL